MKKPTYKYSLFLVVLMMVSACPSDDTTASDLAFENLSGNWTLGTTGSIEQDGEDVSLNFPGFTLSFADGTYATTSGGNLFRASGTWEWANEDGTTIILDTNEEVTILELTASLLRFSFFHAGNSRAGIQGSYVVEVSK